MHLASASTARQLVHHRGSPLAEDQPDALSPVPAVSPRLSLDSFSPAKLSSCSMLETQIWLICGMLGHSLKSIDGVDRIQGGSRSTNSSSKERWGAVARFTYVALPGFGAPLRRDWCVICEPCRPAKTLPAFRFSCFQ